MATEKQIAANRANAKRSTGPKTASGKVRSSRNAFRHGLSRPLPDEALTMATIDATVGALFDNSECKEEAPAFARAQLELQRIREVRYSLWAALTRESFEPRELRRLMALDRYERVAQTKARRAKRLVSKRRLLHSDG
jgi:hypothetical protein